MKNLIYIVCILTALCRVYRSTSEIFSLLNFSNLQKKFFFINEKSAAVAGFYSYKLKKNNGVLRNNHFLKKYTYYSS